MAFTRNPSTGIPATYTGTNQVDSLVLINEASQITIEGLDANDSVIVTGAALQNRALSGYTIYGNDGSDSITVSQANTLSTSLIQGGNGDDNIFVSAFMVNSTVRGGTNDDLIRITNGISASTVNGNKGSDTITVSGTLSNARVFGGSENDVITLNNSAMRNSRANGSDGSDTINVRGGVSMVDSTVFGGAGNDFLNANYNSNDLSFSGDNGNDVVTIGGVADVLNFCNGDNSIVTGSGNDAISLATGAGATANGDNAINAGTGADVITFGALTFGSNTVVFNRGDSVAATANTVAAAPTVANGLTITFANGVDKITGFASFADTIDIDFVDNVFDNLNTDPTGNVLSSTGVFEIQGNLAGNTFTVNNVGGDFLYIVGGGNQTIANAINTSTSIFISDNQLFAANFV